MLLSHMKLEFQNNCTILDVLPKTSSDRDTKDLFGSLGREGRATKWGVHISCNKIPLGCVCFSFKKI